MSHIVNPQHGVTLGGLPLVTAGAPVVHAGGFTTEISADGTTWGNPTVSITQIISALSYGNLVSEDGTGNREVKLYIRISGSAAGHLTAGEKALMTVVRKPRELVWQPPDLGDPVTVYDVQHASMEFVFDDIDELHRERTFVVTLTCLPWPRGNTKVVTPAVTPASPTVLDSGAATTNWTAPQPAGAVRSVISGAVVSTYNPAVVMTSGFYGTYLRRAAAFATTTTKFIAVDWKSSLPAVHALNVNDNPYAQEVEVRREPAPLATYTRSWYRVSDATASVTAFNFSIIHPAGSGSATLSIDQVLVANALPATGTTRQLTATILPAGSVPAEGDVLVQHATAGLGQAVVYTHPAGAGNAPSISRWRTGGNAPVADASTVSGQKISLTTLAAQFEMPADTVPRGDTQLWARLRLATGTAALVGIGIGAGSAMGSAVFDAADKFVNVSLPASPTWVIVPLLRLTLPTRTLGPNGKVRIAMLRSTVHDIELDEAWLFSMDKGRLTVVDCGTGTPATGTVHNRLRIAAASPDYPFGRIEVATASDFSDSVRPDAEKVLSPQTGHMFDPVGSTITTITTGTTDAMVSLEHYPRSHSNVGIG